MKNKIIKKYKKNKRDYNIILCLEATIVATTLISVL